MIKEIPMISMYRGQVVDEMSRENLIEAVKFLGKAYNQACENILFTHELHRKMRERWKILNE